MKALKAIAIVLGGPLAGIFVAFVLGALSLRPDPNFAGHGSPGDGFLVIGYVLVSLLITVPVLSSGCSQNFVS